MHSNMDANASARRRRLALLSTVLALGALASVGPSVPAAVTRPHRPGVPSARAARILDLRDEAHLRFIRSSGPLLVDEGHATGSLPGPAKVRFVYNSEPSVTVYLTISGAGGSIGAKGGGRLSSPTSPDPSFKGPMRVLGGTGRYAHIRGAGELFGVLNRHSHALTVQARGKFPY